MLFLPGLSTRESTDWLAGRGIGLDIARALVQRMGGAIALSSRPGAGFTARVDVPLESGFVSVLWVQAAGEDFALPAANALRVRLAEPGDAPVPHLRSCWGAGNAPARFVIDLDLQSEDHGEPPVRVGVDGIGPTDDLLIRPLAPLIAGFGPFGGAIVRGDGSLRLALDAWAIGPRLRAFGAEA
jgi:two-component system chemotaxis sensor kinase CheA